MGNSFTWVAIKGKKEVLRFSVRQTGMLKCLVYFSVSGWRLWKMCCGNFWMWFSVFVLKLVLLSCKVVQLQFQFALKLPKIILWALVSSFWSIFDNVLFSPTKTGHAYSNKERTTAIYVCHGFHVASHVEPNVEGYAAFGWLFFHIIDVGVPL